MNTTVQRYSNFTWIPNGSGVTFYYSDPSEGEQPAKKIFRIVSRDGTITDRPVGHIGYSFYFPNPAISKLGWFATLSHDSSHLIVENLITARYLEFDAPSKDISDIQWSPSGKTALIFADNDLWLLTPSENTFEKIAENVQMGATDLWVFIPWSYTLDIAVIDKANGQLELLRPDEEPPIIPIELPTSFENPQTTWFPEGNRLFISGFHNDDYVNYIYDLEAADLEEQDNIQQGPFYSSSDQRYRIIDIDGPIIIDEMTGEQTPIRPHSSMIEDNGIDSDFLYANWHPNAYWAITANVPVDYMDTSYDPQTIAVTNRDGSIRRELGTCFYYCADWLPDFVDIQKLPTSKASSVVPAPTKFYDIGEGFIYWLSWSPDGKRLAAILRNENLLLQVWEIEGFSLISQEVIDENINRAIWVANEDGSYTMRPADTIGEGVSFGMRGGRSDPPISPDGKLYLDWLRNNNNFEIGIYSTESNERVVRLENPRGSHFSGSTKYTPDGKYVFYWSSRDRVHIWNTQTGKLVGLLNIYTDSIALSPDSQQIATGQFNYIQIWNIEDVVATE
jgi:WD40 repeat protein